jgi:hypothetical protein
VTLPEVTLFKTGFANAVLVKAKDNKITPSCLTLAKL